MKYFHSVDVETTSTDPFNGQLLTVGIVTYREDTLEKVDEFYARLDYSTDRIDNQDTYDWWKTVDEEIRKEAWGDKKKRLSHGIVANRLNNYVTDFTDVWADSVFCANPATFDYPWIQRLFAETLVKNPFHYRVLCLRSMAFGLYGNNWGESREATGEFHESEFPHHALFDALAQGKDLVKMITEMRDKE
jgi:DNA polymerase III epsilon subunit-like protein